VARPIKLPNVGVAPLCTPLMHGVGRMPLPALNGAFDGLYGPGDQWYWRADFVNEIPDAAIALNEEWNTKMPSWKSGSHIYPIDGAAHDIASAGAGAFDAGHVSAQLYLRARAPARRGAG
jgi:hypothetical protein